jgi:DNA replication protein DnaC
MPPVVKKMLADPRLGVREMVAGVTPERGFGLMGATGTGKTFALAAVLKRMAVARWKRLAAVEGLRAKKQFARWVRWPEVVAEFRMSAAREGGQDAVAEMVDAWSEVEVLVVDDLGAERAKSEYSEEWTSSLLDLVIDRRYNDMRPTWWTANLAPEEFGARYGTRMWSRLAGQNPAVLVPSGPDLRVV